MSTTKEAIVQIPLDRIQPFKLIKQMAAAEGVTESLKRRDQMAWVQRMNNIRARADEIVRNDLIYV